MLQMFRAGVLLITAFASTVSTAYSADNVLVGPPEVFSRSTNGVSGLPAANFDAETPSIAVDPNTNKALVVWSADDAGTFSAAVSGDTKLRLVDNEYEIFARLVDTEINEPAGSQIRVSVMGDDTETAPAERIRYAADNPAVAWNPVSEEFLVVWHGDDDAAPLVDDEFEIFAQRVDLTGARIGQRIRVSQMGTETEATAGERARYGAFQPSIAVNPVSGSYLIVWHGDDNETGAASGGNLADDEFEVFGKMIESDGQSLGSQFRISFMGDDSETVSSERARYDATNARVTYNPASGSFWVVWQGDDNRNGLVDDEYEIYAQQVTLSGTLQGTTVRLSAMGPDGDASYQAFSPDVTVDTTTGTMLVVWHGDTAQGALIDDEFEVYGRLLDPTGALPVSQFRISAMGFDGENNAANRIKFAGTAARAGWNPKEQHFLVVWRGDSSAGELVDDQYEVFGQLVNTDASLYKGRFQVSEQYLKPAEPDEDEEPVDDTADRIKFAAFDPGVAFSAGAFQVIWSGDSNAFGDGRMQVYVRRIADQNALLVTALENPATMTKAPNPIRVEVTVTNRGEDIAENVVLRASQTGTFPMEFSGCVSMPEDTTCTVGDIQPEETKTVHLILLTDHLTLDDTLSNLVTVIARSDTALQAPVLAEKTIVTGASVSTEGGSGAFDWLLLSLLLGLPLVTARRS